MDKLVSVIIPCYNEEKNIVPFYNEINNAFKGKIKKYELIFVNDGSTDNTKNKINEIVDSNCIIVNFSKNFGKEAAMYAGLNKSKGEYVVIIDSDLQQDPKYIVEMKEILDNDSSIDEVCAYQKKRIENPISKLFKFCFYRIMSKETNLDIKSKASDFRMFRRKVVDAIKLLSEKSRFSKGIFAYVGFNIKYIPYEVNKRVYGKSKYNLKSLFKYAFNGITDFSVKPLYLQIKFGILVLLSGIITLIISLLSDLGLNFILFSILLIVISIMTILNGISSYYIGKIFIEVKNRPVYIEDENEKKKC